MHPTARGAKTNLLAKTIFEDEIRAEDDIRRRFSDPSGPGAKTNLLAKTIFEDDFRTLLAGAEKRTSAFSDLLKTIFEDDFRTFSAGGRRRISWRRRYSKTIFGPFRPGGEDEFVGEDDIRRRFSDLLGRGAAKTKWSAKTIFEDDFSTPSARGRRRGGPIPPWVCEVLI